MTSKTTILAVVISLAVFALAALAGTIWLIHDKIASSAVAVIATPMGMALGALASLLASTRGTLSAGDVEPTVIAGAQQIGSSPEPSLMVDKSA